jgi:anti-anti-sigma regulatory factor
VGLRKRVRAAKGDLVLFGLNATLTRLMDVTKMTKIFAICATEEAALEGLLKKK